MSILRCFRALSISVVCALVLGACSPAPIDEAAPTTTAPDALASVESTTTAPSTTTTASTVPPAHEFAFGPGRHELEWLADQAALVVLDNNRGTDTLDLTGMPNMADRVALGLAELGVAFTRSASPDEHGSYGTVLALHDDPAQALTQWPALESSWDAGAEGVRTHTETALAAQEDILVVAESNELMDRSKWVVAQSASPLLLATELETSGPEVIAWSNREAQRYVTDAVSFDNTITITTASRQTVPSVEQLPYDSGMIISTIEMGWGAVSATVTLPEGDGLWPAIWLLDAEACVAPGRCSGYLTPGYNEIDVLELRGQEPELTHLSLHWWDERVRSSSGTAPLADRSVTVELERRPGLLVWRLDGEVVQVIAERVDTFHSGPHRAGSMKLIVNTAVGGSFAGTVEVGRDGVWLGEALVPSTYPAALATEFVVSALRIDSIG